MRKGNAPPADLPAGQAPREHFPGRTQPAVQRNKLKTDRQQVAEWPLCCDGPGYSLCKQLVQHLLGGGKSSVSTQKSVEEGGVTAQEGGICTVQVSFLSAADASSPWGGTEEGYRQHHGPPGGLGRGSDRTGALSDWWQEMGECSQQRNVPGIRSRLGGGER